MKSAAALVYATNKERKDRMTTFYSERAKRAAIEEQQRLDKQNLVGLNPFQVYMKEAHGEDVSADDPTPAEHRDLAFTASGALALYGDEELEKKLGLPSYIRAVQSPNGVVHQVFDPAMAAPKFIGTHDVAQPHQENVLVH